MPQHYKELVALHSYTAELSEALSDDPSERWFPDRLIAKDLISKRAVENILTRNDCAYDKFSRIFSTLCKTIATASSQMKASEIFNELVAILRDELKFKDLADQLESKCEESKDTPYSSSSSLNADNALKRSNSDSNVSTDSGALSNDSDIDSVNVLCKCPCGITDFKHCIQPPPDCLDKGFAEMHLSIGEDTKKAQNYMEQQLALDTKILKDKYVKFGMEVYAFALSTPNRECTLKKILKLKKQKIKSFSFEDLHDQIIEDADFINYEPIKSILKACTSVCLATGHAKTDLQHAAEVALEKYEEAFQKYAKHRVYAIASHLQELSTTSTKDMHTQLKIKVEEEFKTFPIERINYFRHCVKEILKLPEETQLRVILVREGCVELTFQLIGLAGDIPFQLSIDQKRELASQKISMLEYAGEVEYCCCELFEDEIGKGMVIEMYEEVCQRNFQCDDMDDNQEDDATNSDGYFEAMAANNPGTELDAFNKLKLHTSKNVGSEDQKKFCDRSVSPFRHELDKIASPLMVAPNPVPVPDAFNTPFTSKNVGTDDQKNFFVSLEKWLKSLQSLDTDTDLEEQYEPCAAGKDPQSRERLLSQDDQVCHSYFQAPGNPSPHSPPSILSYSDHGSSHVGSLATLPRLPQEKTWKLKVDALIAQQANATGFNVSGITPLDLACQQGHANMTASNPWLGPVELVIFNSPLASKNVGTDNRKNLRDHIVSPHQAIEEGVRDKVFKDQCLDPQQEAENDYSDLSEAAEYMAEMQTLKLRFRHLVIATSNKLNDSKVDLKEIVHHMKVKHSSMGNKSPCATELLFELKGNEIFTSDNMEPLRDIQRAINHSDIVEDLLSEPLGIALDFRTGTPAPSKWLRPVDAVVHGEVAYFRRYCSKTIYTYSKNGKSWSKLPLCPVENTSLALLPIDTIGIKLHTVGGRLLVNGNENIAGHLYHLSERDRADCNGVEKCWVESSSIPAMKVKRKLVTAICDREYKHMIVAGGCKEDAPSSVVEVLNIETKQWSTVAASLPQRIFRSSGCINNEYVYLLGGCVNDDGGHQKNVCRVSLSTLINSKDGDRVFEKMAELRHLRSASTIFCDQVLAIGGTIEHPETKEASSTNCVYVYDPKNDSWKQTFTLKENRCFCFAASFTQPRQLRGGRLCKEAL